MGLAQPAPESDLPLFNFLPHRPFRRAPAFRIVALLAALAAHLPAVASAAPPTRATRLTIAGGRWHLNGTPTYPDSKAEGLLMNVRMVNATFEDRGRPEWDADANTERFIVRIPAYVAQGVRAFTLNLQGGMPGYEGAVNSAFEPDGRLRETYLRRVARVIEACDRAGAAVILGCFYQRQDQILRDDDAVRAAVTNVALWIRREGYTNVALEIANEYGHRGFDRTLLKTDAGQAELIRLAQRTAPGLLVSTSETGSRGAFAAGFLAQVAPVCDFLLIHLNLTPVDAVAGRLAALPPLGKPVVCNEDQKVGDDAARTAEICVAHGVAWGFMHVERNQQFPFAYDGADDDPQVYAMLRTLTAPASRRVAEYFPPADAAGGWRTVANDTAAKDVAGLDRRKLDEAFDYAAGSTKNGGLVVVRHGWLVYERYFGLGHREATPNLASCGKSFTSIAVGILMAERPELFPDGLDQKIFTPEYFPAAGFPLGDPRKADIKLGQLLAFTSGIRGNNPSFVLGRPVTLDPPGPDGWQAGVDAIALGQQNTVDKGVRTSTATLWCEPGGGYSYSTSAIHLAAIMLRHLTGQELDRFLETHLGRPLGWGQWGYGYRGVYSPGHIPGGGGIALRATDMLRFGYLLLHEGSWEGRQVVPAAYVRAATRATPYNPHFPYSLQFNVNTRGEAPDLPRDAFWKHGSGGHVLYVVPSLDLVVWKLGGRDPQYAEADTQLPTHPAARAAKPRRDWKQTVDDAEAVRGTLQRVIAAIER